MQLTPEAFIARWQQLATALAVATLPLLCIILAAGVLINLVQVGFLFLPQKLMPDLQRISPLEGFRRIFSLTGLVRLLFGLFKIVIVASVALICLRAQAGTLLNLVGLEVGPICRFLAEISLWTCLKAGAALFVLALLDYAYQFWKREQDLRMTPQEVREEMKRLQGDPQVIARRRVVQRQLALHRLSSDVRKADVVVTNPTELAVAVQYDAAKMAAPVVIAKGAGTLAERIRQIAAEHGIPIVERKPLAQALYREVDVGKPIPGKLYAAVAELLAYVYQMQGRPLPHS